MTITLTKHSSSILEEDLAISSSTLGTSDKSLSDEPQQTCNNTVLGERLVYVNEDAMDCCYDESNSTSAKLEVIQEVSSPEMFNSDSDDDLENSKTSASFRGGVGRNKFSLPKNSPKPKTQQELVVISDNNLLSRINRYLSGVPPPPKHTICQSDCSEFLVNIRKNAHLFWSNPLETETNSSTNKTSAPTPQTSALPSDIKEENLTSTSIFQNRVKNSTRNLSVAFDACDLSKDSETKSVVSHINSAVDEQSIDTSCTESVDTASIFTDKTSSVSTTTTTSQVIPNENSSTTLKMSDQTIFNTCSVNVAASLTWPEAYQHKCFGIHYNRNKPIEEFEKLSMKMCERYVGAETQSTCNVFFTKQCPGSARKRSLLSKRNSGQSPGKRLSYLTKRRRTFSSANLQGLGEKKQLVLNIRKPLLKKGKSPRSKGKSPRGKSPRGKSPRSSAKKRAMRRLSMDGPTPRKSKLETSKRALFQSPPNDKAGPSMSGLNPQRIKKALFPTPTKKGDESDTMKAALNLGDARKRKSDEELENPRFKWAKSLSFDCTRDLDSRSANTWNQQRHSTGNIISKNENLQSYGKCELSTIHRKKLLWAVSEALRGKGISMSHPQFKQHAATVARTVKKLMPDLENKNIPRKPGSTSDRMLKLAKQQVLKIDTKPTDH